MVEQVPSTLQPAQARLILVVDDEPRMIRFIRMNLELEGYQVIEARNGLAALEQLRQYLPDLVIMDVMMPEMDGTTLVRALRSLDPGVALIVASGLDDEERRKELSVLGVSEILPKPCGADELLGALRRALDMKG